LGWVSTDTPIQVMSLLGLAFLLLLAGLEVDYARFRGRVLRLTVLAYAISFGLALLIGLGLHAAGLVKSPLLVGIALSATSVGIVIPVLKDAGQAGTPFGQLVIAGASIAEIAPIVLVSLFFSGEASGIGVQLVLLGLFALFVIAVGVGVLGAERSMRMSAALLRLQNVGYGVFIPVFFVATGVGFELNALFANATNLARVPIFLTALLVARGLPALVYRSLTNRTQTIAAGLLQATSLSFLVVVGQIGVQLGLLRPAVYAALVAAGLVSVLIFPLMALTLLRTVEKESVDIPDAAP
jgi:Kef-type K+ transport system membrane component KefB